MAYVSLKYLRTVCLGTALTLIFTNCVAPSSASDFGSEKLPLGLYKVVERDCSYPLNVPEDCSRTQYLELAKGAFQSLDKDEIAFVTWLSDNPDQEHVFNVRDLRNGRLINAQEYVIEKNSMGKDWFLIADGKITDYIFFRYPRTTPVGDMTGRTHLALKRINRTERINHLLQYPAAENP